MFDFLLVNILINWISILGCDLLMVFENPLLSNYTSKQITLTGMNRCTQYPRCLLFDCCDPSLVTHVHQYFKNQRCHSFPQFSCMIHSIQNEKQICPYNIPLTERANKIDLLHVTITHSMIEDRLARLPPTHPQLYEVLAQRKEFKIIYLAQGEDRSGLDPVFQHIKQDFIFLSYKKQVHGDLYFPKSNLCYGRLALYLFARQLELSQGWLYTYFIFMDDDADWNGSIQGYENSLQSYLPAIGVPGYLNMFYPKNPMDSISHVDFIVIGYHREALEVLHPWILDYDENCVWASQLLQSIESAVLYRNHQIAFNTMKVINSKHHKYPQKCWSEVPIKPPEPLPPFDLVMESHYQALPKQLKHCAVRDLKYFRQGDVSGMARHKGNVTYHLMYQFKSNDVTKKPIGYARYDQNGTCPISDHFDRVPVGCCSIDIVFNH